MNTRPRTARCPGILTSLLVLCVASSASAQTASLRGRVLTDSTEHPVAGAIVSIDELKIQATSDSLGNFVLPGIKPGAHIVTAKRIGFGALATRVRFAAGAALEADFLLTPNVQSLPDVKVETKAPVRAKLQEFEERRTSGIGRFLTDRDFDDRAWSSVSAVLNSKVPGLQIVRDGRHPSQAYVAAGRMQTKGPVMSSGGTCLAAVVLDGAFVYQGNPGEMPFNINTLPTNVIAGMEYYAGPASMPVKYSGQRNGSCGLIVVWTR